MKRKTQDYTQKLNIRVASGIAEQFKTLDIKTSFTCHMFFESSGFFLKKLSLESTTYGYCGEI